jgi:Glycosyl hydrolases family 43
MRWMQNRFRKVAVFFALGGAAVAMSGCLMPPSSQNTVRAFPNTNIPDPTMVPEHGGGVSWTEVFGGSADGKNVPMYTLPNPPNAAWTGPVEEALATMPSTPYKTQAIWAPSVMFIGGRYLMMYSEYFDNLSRANCIGEATSTDGLNFTPTSFYLCSPDYTHGYLDPSLFVDLNGNIYFTFSEQWNSCGGPSGGGSQLWVWQLNSNGTSPVGSPTLLLTWAQATQVKGLPSSLGNTPCLENPQLDLDPYNTYDLLFSIGTWNSNATEVSGEVACGALNDSSSGCGIDPSGGAVLENPGGGASTLTTGYPDGNYLIWDKWVGSNREDYVGPTSGCNPSKTTC